MYVCMYVCVWGGGGWVCVCGCVHVCMCACLRALMFLIELLDLIGLISESKFILALFI